MNPVQTANEAALTRKECLRFAGIFLSLIAVFYALTLSPWVDAKLLLPVLKASARLASLLINLLGGATDTHGVVIRGATFSVAVRRGCDPFEPIILFGAALVAFRAPVRQKLVGFLLGASLLFVINVARVATLYFAGKAQLQFFYALHQEWWPAFFIFAAILVWILWLAWVRRIREV